MTDKESLIFLNPIKSIHYQTDVPIIENFYNGCYSALQKIPISAILHEYINSCFVAVFG